MGTQPEGENDARERASDLEALLAAVTDRAIVELDSLGNVAYWSPGAQELLGYADTEVLGQRASMFYTDDDRAGGLAENELALARESGRFESEGWRVRKDGRRFRAHVAVTAIRDEGGSVRAFAKVLRDLDAELERASTTFHALLELAPDAMVIVGPDGRITLANAQTDRMFGYEREDLVGEKIEMLLPSRFRGDHIRYRSDFFADPRVRQMGADLELFALRRDGTEFPVEVSLGPLRIEGADYVSAAIRDVTERRAYEQRLRRQHEEIMELSTPVIQVWDKVLTLPLIGTLDSMRAARLTEGLLNRIGETQAEVVIFDISGVPTIDTMVAQHLLRTVQAAALMGTVSIMCGLRPETAQAMVHLGIDVGQLLSRGTLQDALQLALALLAERSEMARGAGEALGRNGQQ
ncbi:MAG: PAS domain S-box protein [Mycobacterium sp.]|nr:PAS domain S-box protein [Mycobacterium sp.]